jgi:hypothetical protein
MRVRSPGSLGQAEQTVTLERTVHVGRVEMTFERPETCPPEMRVDAEFC